MNDRHIARAQLVRTIVSALLLPIVWLILAAVSVAQNSPIDPIPILNASDPQVQNLIGERHYEQAEAILVHELQESPTDGQHLLMLAQLYFNENRYDESSAMLDAANRAAGATSNGEMLAGLIQVVRGNSGVAREQFVRALNPDKRDTPTACRAADATRFSPG